MGQGSNPEQDQTDKQGVKKKKKHEVRSIQGEQTKVKKNPRNLNPNT